MNSDRDRLKMAWHRHQAEIKEWGQVVCWVGVYFIYLGVAAGTTGYSVLIGQDLPEGSPASILALTLGMLNLGSFIWLHLCCFKVGVETTLRKRCWRSCLWSLYAFAWLWFIDLHRQQWHALLTQHLDIVVAIILALLIFHRKPARIVEHPLRASAQQLPTAELGPESPELRFVTCIHEAGHALIYASLVSVPRLPLTASVARHGRQGYVVGGIDDPVLSASRPFLYFEMMLVLAGMAAEKWVYGEYLAGCESDLNRWYCIADKYLRNGYGGIFYPAPKTGREQFHNKIQLEELKRKQEILLQRFMAANAPLLRKLADVLYEKGVLNDEEITPFLAAVVIPEGFPTC